MDAETCECRTFAIGRCLQCQKPVCMHHSRLLDGRTMCVPHYNGALSLKAPTAEAPDIEAEATDRRGRRGWGRRR